MRLGRALGLPAALLLGACAGPRVPPAPPLSAEIGAERLGARSLREEGLRRFLAENLGREPAAWDFEALSWVSFYYHPSLGVARAQWTAARAARKTAGALANPTVALIPGYSTTHQAGISPWLPAVNLDFLIQTARKRGYRQAVASADAESARLGVIAAAWQVRSELRRALAAADAAGRRQSLLRREAEVQQRLVSLLEERHAAGALGAAEVSTARTAMLRAQAASAEAAASAFAARARIAAALGLPLSALDGVTLAPLPAAPALLPDGLEAARGLAVRSRADVLAALAKYASAQAALELEVAKQWPDFHLGPGYQWDQGVSKWTLGLTFELPLFNHNEGPIAEAVARRAEAAAQFGAVQAQVLASVDAAVAAQRAAANQLLAVRQLRAEREHQAAAMARRLRLGAADQLEVQSAQLDLAMTDSVIGDAENAALVAAAELDAALQAPFPGLATLADPQSSPPAASPP